MTKGEQMAKILADTLSGCPLLDPCNKIWTVEGWCKDHCKPGQQEPDAECWLKYAEAMVKEAEHSTDSSLAQNELDVPGTNVGDIYECSCGYGWDKSKVFRHHFCPNCGRAVEPSCNLTKTELNGDMVSRQKAIEAVEKESQVDGAYGYMDTKSIVDLLNDLPPAQPNLQPTCSQLATDTISRQAAIDALNKRFDDIPMEQTQEILLLRRDLRTLPSAQPERKKGKWVGTEFDGYADGNPVYCEWKCSACGCVVEDEEPAWNYCPNCGADMRG